IYVLCVAYILGLLLTGLSHQWDSIFPGLLTVGMLGMMGVGAIASFLMPRLWRMGPRAGVWLMAGVVGMMAGLYLQVRSPTYDALMQSVPPEQQPIFPMMVDVQGYIGDSPRLTRSQRVRFTLHVTDIQDDGFAVSFPSDRLKPITQTLYVTVPLLQGTGLYPGEAIALHGRLYRPESASTPGAFDFQRYLAQQGIFIGLSGDVVQVGTHIPDLQLQHPTSWHLHQRFVQCFGKRFWQMRQRIVRSFVQGLQSPAGPLLSGMVLGRKAVDMPYEISDQFIQAGLAHILAASGFHVSLLLGVILAIGGSLSPRQRLILGSLTLGGYLCLTGLQPSVCRAALMGLAVLLATVSDRTIRPVGALLTIVTVLLCVTPQWIWDLGFQLSVLATLGLMISVPWIVKRLSWMPPLIATLIAVPIAATFWTLPILLRTMGTILPYSPLLNMMMSIPITLISVVGMVTGAIALLLPPLGTVLAGFLYWPIQGLMAMVLWTNQLPGQSIALGTISVGQLLLIYGLYGAIAWTGTPSFPLHHQRVGQVNVSYQSLRRFMALAVAMVVVIPIAYAHYQTVQITVFAIPSSQAPMMVVQHRGQVGIINNGSEDDVIYTLLPFLRHEGINRIHWAIASHAADLQTSGWQRLAQSVPISHHYTLSPTAAPDRNLVSLTSSTLPIGSRASLTLLSTAPTLLELTLDDYVWLMIADTLPESKLAQQDGPIIPASYVGHQDSSDDDGASDAVMPLATTSEISLGAPLNASLGTSLETSPGLVQTLPPSHIWCWSSVQNYASIHQLTEQQQPQEAIVTTVLPNTDALRSILDTLPVPLYVVNRDYAIQWQPRQGFSTTPDQRYDISDF
ncbi:MAG: ComEC family competence protein, partial [Merismopedia sp. SIO2A8]|nr:ComEC family competence protein [Merismopedia sp. SIO2A8]